MFILSVALFYGALAKDVSIDFFLVQDLSHSYKTDLPHLQTQIPEVVTYLATEYRNSRFGMASFVDKPLGSFGYLESEDFCYELNVPLMNVENEIKENGKKSEVRGILKEANGDKFDLKEVLANLDTYSGRDRKENQLGALLHALLSADTKWDTENRVPIIALATDDKFHVYGDGKAAGLIRTEGAYSGPVSSWCLTEDYPTINDIKLAIEKIGAKVIFLVTDNMVKEYNKLLHAIGPDNGVVVELKNRSQFIAQVIKHGISHMDLDGDSFGDAAADHMDKLAKVEKLNNSEEKQPQEAPVPPKKDIKGFTVIPDLLNSTPLISCPPNIIFDIVLVQDASASYEDDLPQLQKKVPKVFKNIIEHYPGSRVGLSAFVDKPIEPFGYSESGDYCSIVFEGLTKDVDALSKKLKTLQIRSGDDPLESQLHALVHVAHSKKANWNFEPHDNKDKRIIRVAAMVTDAGYHQAGDTDLPKHSGTTVDCDSHDYPSVEQAAKALKKKKIFPMFLVTPEVENLYEDLLSKMEINGVVSLNDDVSASINKAILSGLETICGMSYIADPESIEKEKLAKIEAREKADLESSRKAGNRYKRKMKKHLDEATD